MSFVRFMPVMRFYWDVFRLSYARHTFLSKCLACGSIQMSCVRSAPVIRSYRYVLRSITPAVCRIAPNRTACDMLRSYSAVGRDRHSCVLGSCAVIGLCWFTSGLRVSLWRSRRRTKERGNAENGGNGERSRRWGVSALLRDHIGFAMFSAGSPLGRNVEAALRPRPRLRQRVFDSLDSLHWIRGVGTFYAVRASVNPWP